MVAGCANPWTAGKGGDMAVMTDDAPAVVWFRDDLRLADQAALHAAVETGRPVLPVFILDDAAAGKWALGGASRWWLHHSLASLQASLAEQGVELTLRRGDSVAVIGELAAEVGAAAVFTGGSADPWFGAWTRRRLRCRGSGCTENARRRCFNRTRCGRRRAARSVSTRHLPMRVWRWAGRDRRCPAPARIRAARAVGSERLKDWGLLPGRPDWAGGLRDSWTPGEAGALARAEAFLVRGLPSYDDARDRPGEDGTSMLSPHLHSARYRRCSYGIWRIGSRTVRDGRRSSGNCYGASSARICCGIIPGWRRLRCGQSSRRCRGGMMRRGYGLGRRGGPGCRSWMPGWRQLWKTGWMHNRVRMIVASFLVKHLMIPWQVGEAWFWDTLVDADLASNAANWQWVAGCGADAAPYFRIFNPVLQGRKFDADGAYVRRFVPERAGSTGGGSMRRGRLRLRFWRRPGSGWGRPIRRRSSTWARVAFGPWPHMHLFARSRDVRSRRVVWLVRAGKLTT